MTCEHTPLKISVFSGVQNRNTIPDGAKRTETARTDYEDARWRFHDIIYAPTTNAPARNANVEAYINPDPNPNPNPNPYPALNQKPNHTHESNSVFGEVSMPEQLSPEHMSCHRAGAWILETICQAS